MGKSVEFSEKAENHESKAEYWAKRANDINLSMPESIEFYEYKVEEAKMTHEFYKQNPDKREFVYWGIIKLRNMEFLFILGLAIAVSMVKFILMEVLLWRKIR